LRRRSSTASAFHTPNFCPIIALRVQSEVPDISNKGGRKGIKGLLNGQWKDQSTRLSLLQNNYFSLALTKALSLVSTMQFKLAAIAALLVPTLVVAAPQGGDLCITNCANEAAVAVGCRDA
jgi:hypothetical protein